MLFRFDGLLWLLLAIALVSPAVAQTSVVTAPPAGADIPDGVGGRPNVLLILADDQGCFDKMIE